MYNNYSYLYESCLSCFGGYYSDGLNAGTFCLIVIDSAASSDAYLGGRLIFL